MAVEWTLDEKPVNIQTFIISLTLRMAAAFVGVWLIAAVLDYPLGKAVLLAVGAGVLFFANTITVKIP